ncbi:MAG: T9SS type A sorting domain-containing protein [Candidatus Krumholzibacteria bacterium]|nr:T9SS type A sorting domain-containing protein [Candidatus Krumholzibacteria bacterium]
MKKSVATILALLFVITLGGSASAQVDASNDMSWLDGFSLVILESNDVAGLHRARTAIQSHGGRVAIMSPPSLILGWIPFETRTELIGKAGIRGIYYTEVSAGEVNTDDPQSGMLVRYYNSVVRGDIQRKHFEEAERTSTVKRWPENGSDAMQPPPRDQSSYIENLRAIGLDVDQLKNQGILLQANQATAGNSDAMTGTVSVTLFFVESDGSGSDPDTYTWTDEHVQEWVDGVNTGLAWWTSQAYNYFDCWNAFLVRYFPPTDSRCQQQYEPVLHDSGFASTWVSLVMGQFGYTSGNHFSRVDAYNTFQRTTYGTDWAYSAFIGYNPPGAPAQFTNGTSAFAWLGGPYTVLLYRSFSWPPYQVFAHETGHIFLACDEYSGSGCSCTSCVGKPNQNCYLCSSGLCMMKSNDFTLCAWTPAQIGWVGPGCAPPPLPAPATAGVSPSGGLQGVRTTIQITGSDFVYGATADLGPDVIVHGTAFVNSTTLDADITVGNEATLGFVDVTVTNRDLQSSTLLGAFEILVTPRHYVSVSGTNVFPYLNPSQAATSLTDAINAAGNGDSVLVETGIYPVSDSVSVTHGMILSGAWNGSFNARDLATGKCVVDLAFSASQTVLVVAGGEAVTIDGFIIENGTGSRRGIPAVEYGGGLYVDGATLTLSNCEIRSNAALTGGGVGGGVYASASTIDFRDLVLLNNTATQGGAIFLDDCTGSLTNNTISANEGFTTGGGAHVVNCSTLTFVDNVFTGNSTDVSSGGFNGGGLFVSNSTDIVVSGGEISNNDAEGTGGGVYYETSDLVLDAVLILRNTSSLGGGVGSGAGTGSFTIAGCDVLWNAASTGGGAFISGTAYINHNLFVGNSAGGLAGAAFISGSASGSVVGNTLDRNTAPTTGGFFLSSVSLPIVNNVIVNSGDVGVNCVAGSPTLDYNNVWNSGVADYQGCAPGTGSLSRDPLFADTAMVDYHLTVHSPCIDAGDPNPTYDDPDGSRADMGIYGSHTFVMDQPSYPKNLNAAISGGEITLLWRSNPEPDVEWYAVYKDSTPGFAPSSSNFIQLVAAPDTMFDGGVFEDSTFFKISAVDTGGYASGYSNEVGGSTPTAVGRDIATYGFRLYQNHPNPFNPVTYIRYEIGGRSRVVLSIFDVRGRLVRRIVNATRGPGVYTAQWDGRNDRGESVTSGIYFYRLTAGGDVRTKKMVMLK